MIRNEEQKLWLIFEGAMIFISLIFNLSLHRFGNELIERQRFYESDFFWATSAMSSLDFWLYLALGLVLVAFLLWMIAKSFINYSTLGFVFLLILVVNSLLVWLLISTLNHPIFTILSIGLACGGVYYAYSKAD